MQPQPFVATCDVTRHILADAGSAADVEGAISSKTNAQQSGPPQLYTSTPYKKGQQQQHGDPVGFCNIAKSAASATSKRYKFCVGGSVIGQHYPRLKALLPLFAILFFGYVSVIRAMPYLNVSNVQQLSSYVQGQLSSVLDWSQEQQLRSKLSPLICGLLVAAFSYALVYLDSAVPGLSPPAPFSPRSKQRYRRERSASLHLGYICALGSGLVVALLMYVDL